MDEPHLTDAEWKVMDVVWDRGPVAVRDVHGALEASTRWAYTTVKTLLDRLEGTEDPLAILRGDPAPLVGDPQLEALGGAREREEDHRLEPARERDVEQLAQRVRREGDGRFGSGSAHRQALDGALGYPGCDQTHDHTSTASRRSSS